MLVILLGGILQPTAANVFLASDSGSWDSSNSTSVTLDVGNTSAAQTNYTPAAPISCQVHSDCEAQAYCSRINLCKECSAKSEEEIEEESLLTSTFYCDSYDIFTNQLACCTSLFLKQCANDPWECKSQGLSGDPKTHDDGDHELLYVVMVVLFLSLLGVCIFQMRQSKPSGIQSGPQSYSVFPMSGAIMQQSSGVIGKMN